MKYLLYAVCLAGASCLDASPRPLHAAGLWVQMAMTPPGTNGAASVEVVPGVGSTPSGQVVPMTGVVGVPVVGGEPRPTALGDPASTAPETMAPSAPAVPVAPAAAAPPSSIVTGTPREPVRSTPAVPEPLGPQAPALPAKCAVVFPKEPQDVAALGSVVELKLAFTPATCATAPKSMNSWIQRAASEGGAYRFSVAPNPTSSPREGSIALGPHELLVRQEGGKVALFAASPSKVVVAAGGGKASKPAVFSVWAEDPSLAYSVAPGDEKWLTVRAAAAKKGSQSRRFELAVDATNLPRGRHEAVIRVAANGVVNGLLLIPVVVEVR